MAGRAAEAVRARVDAWRSGSIRAQWTVAAALVVMVVASFVISMVNRGAMPLTAYFLWLLVSRILLSFRPLVVVVAVDACAGSLSLLLQEDMSPIRWVAVAEFMV